MVGKFKLLKSNNWEGQTNTESGDTFVKFKTPEHGIRALTKVVTKNIDATNSYEEYVNRYASEPTEKEYYKKHGKLLPHLQNYADVLAKSQGISNIKSKPININILEWLKATAKAEGGSKALDYFTDDVIKRGIELK